MESPSNDARPRNIFLEHLKSISGHFAQTFGGLPEQHEDSLRRRLTTASDPEPEHADPQSLDYAQKLADARRDLIIILTANRACRIFTILVLGLWGGWSLMPAETRCPDSVAWVTYICIAADW